MPTVHSTRHVLAVNDLRAATTYFIDVLGFSRDFSADGWEFLSFGDFKVMLGECPDEVPARATNNHSYFAYVVVEGIDQLYATFEQRGAVIPHPVENKPWGMREFGVTTPEGHRMMFGEEIAT